MYFAQKCPQNAGNAVSETHVPPDPLEWCRHYGLPLTKILATLLLPVLPFLHAARTFIRAGKNASLNISHVGQSYSSVGH